MQPLVPFDPSKKKPPRPDPGGDVDPNPNPAQKYAYIVGISDYEDTVNDLSYCDDDARDMKAYLQSEGFSCRIDTDRYYVTQGFVMEKFNAVDCTKKIMTLGACLIGGFHAETTDGTLMATASDNSYS